jgi:hypothetical protein
VNVSFLAVLPVALIVIGVVLVGAARTGGHRGLIALGVIITVILTIASSFDIRLRGGVGDRTERPASAADLHGEYHLSLGQLTIDLRAVALADSSTPRRLKASVGMGQLTVRIPSDSFVEATGHVGAGQVTIFGRKNSGLDVELSERALPPARSHVSAVAPLILDLSVGVGQIVVTR